MIYDGLQRNLRGLARIGAASALACTLVFGASSAEAKCKKQVTIVNHRSVAVTIDWAKTQHRAGKRAWRSVSRGSATVASGATATRTARVMPGTCSTPRDYRAFFSSGASTGHSAIVTTNGDTVTLHIRDVTDQAAARTTNYLPRRTLETTPIAPIRRSRR